MPSSSAVLPRALPAPELEAVSLEQRSLVRAFALFTDAAASLERSYSCLQAEVARLRRELEQTHRDLSLSRDKSRRIQHHLDKIVEALPCGVLVIEAGGELSVANPEARRLLGIPGEWLLAVEDQLPDWTEKLLERTSAGDAEQEHHCARESAEWLAVRHAKLGAEAGGASIFILRDTAPAKRLEQAQATLRRKQALTEMSSLLAHEIRNPLASLELFAGLLAEAKLEGERGQWVAQVRAGLRTLAATVNNVLHFHGQPALELAPTDLGQLLEWLEEFLEPVAQQARVEVTLEHQLNRVSLSADRHRLEQVLLNLALNAFRFMPEGGTLKISGQTTTAGKLQRARLEIADSGSGIRAEDLPRIFEPGFSTRPGSPGLGLAVCQTIVDQHQGTIRAASPPEGGAKFTLEFPLPEAGQ